MLEKQEYIERLRLAVEDLHKCSARHVATTHIDENYEGLLSWKGDVEVFDLTRHPRARRCYAWSHREGNEEGDNRFMAILEIPPIFSAQTAVLTQLLMDAKHRGN